MKNRYTDPFVCKKIGDNGSLNPFEPNPMVKFPDWVTVDLPVTQAQALTIAALCFMALVVFTLIGGSL